MEKRKFRKLTDNDRNAIISLYQTGRAARDIAVFMNIDPSTVHKVLRDNEIKAHYPDRAEAAKRMHIERRPAANFAETPENGQITFDEFEKALNKNPAAVVPLLPDDETFGEDLGAIIYKAVYNAVTDAYKKLI